jgi:hypothetical protein
VNGVDVALPLRYKNFAFESSDLQFGEVTKGTVVSAAVFGRQNGTKFTAQNCGIYSNSTPKHHKLTRVFVASTPALLQNAHHA